jgi:hypothetical protein
MLEIRPTSPLPNASGPIFVGVVEPGVAIEWRPLSSVWTEWRLADGIGPPVTILLMTLCLTPPLAALGAGLHVCTVHRRGRLGPSLLRAFAAIVAASGPLIALGVLAGTGGVVAYELIDPLSYGALQWGVPGEILVWFCVVGPLALLVGAMGRTAAGAEMQVDDAVIPPRCEGCGYDLTHSPTDGRCPECGLAARHSLDGKLYRQGIAWERRSGLGSWFESSWAVLVAPSAFYRMLRLRGEDRSASFRRTQFAAIALGAATWGFMVFAVGGGVSSRQFLLVAPMMVLLGCLFLWTAYRLAAALATIPWLLGDRLPDFRWARRVIGYESVFLWVFCLFNGLLVTAALLPGNFGKWLFTTRAFFWLPLWPTLILFGNLALGLIWIWRYQIALRAIRWSNH